MPEHPPLHVVVPVLDQPEHTLALLACLARQTNAPDAVWVMDNGSHPSTVRDVEELAPVELVVHVEDCAGLTIYECWNRGYWHAKRSADGRPFHVLVVNNDVQLPPYALEWMSQALLDDEACAAAYPDWRQPWDLMGDGTPPGSLLTQETHGVWGSDGMLGYCFMLAGHRIPWRPLIQDLAYGWWYGDNALADSIQHAGLKQVKVLGLPLLHAQEGTAASFDLAAVKERDARLWATRRRLDQVDRLNRGSRPAGRRDWRVQRPPTRGA